MTASETTTRTVPAQPSTRLYQGTTIPSLYELVERYIPTARPLMSVAELRVMLRRKGEL